MKSAVEIGIRETEGCAILDIMAENFTYPHTAVLKTYMDSLLTDGYRLFVFNCSQIDMIDSFGLATIISSLKMIREQGGQLALCNVNSLFADLVTLTHLNRVLEIWSSENQAAYYLSKQYNHLKLTK